MPLSRLELLKALNIVKDGPDLEKLTTKLMVQFEEKEWRESTRATTSFFASQFPGEEKSCERRMLYSLMNLPEVNPVSPKLRGMSIMGNSVEYLIVHRWAVGGITLSGSVPLHYGDPIEQTKFEDEETLLSGATDAILDLRPEYDSVLPVDIKSKDHDVVKQMQVGARSYDPKHYLQVQAYIYFCRKFHDDMGWGSTNLSLAKGGIIYYVSRQDPTFSKQFYIAYDSAIIDKAIKTLKKTKENFYLNKLPARPKDWKWSEEPCKWCPFKKEACKKDWKAGVEELDKSNGIEFAKMVKPSYDYDEVKSKIEERWL